MNTIRKFLLAAILAWPLLVAATQPEIRIISSAGQLVDLYSEAGYWGEEDPAAILEVPPFLTVATVPVWRDEAAAMPVQLKKELFYRSILPLLLYANRAVLKERARLTEIAGVASEGNLPDEELQWLGQLAERYGLSMTPAGRPLNEVIAELLIRVDVIPPSLSLGQGAYESGYGTSRFALEGNSYFGQWTYGGKGMTPARKRKEKGNYGVAAYDWPLDSVRSYMKNINTHSAYADLRARRKTLRDQGREVTGQDLVGTLIRYSERGQAYVDTLESIMRVNGLAVADRARLEDKPPVLIVNAKDSEDARALQVEIDDLAESGELDRLLNEMGLFD